MPPVPRSVPRSRRRAIVADRDRVVLAFLAEHRATINTQTELLLGVSGRAAGERLRALHGHGLVDYRRIFEGLPATVSITRRGLEAIGSTLPVPRVDLKGYRHDVGVAWLWLAAHDGAFGPVAEVTSERALRSAAGGSAQLHYPDMVVSLADGRRVAIELELSAKSPRRLDGIMLGYAGDPRYDVILYLVPPGPLGRRIGDAARRAGIGEMVHVQRLAAGSPAGCQPGSGRTAARSPEREGSRER